MCDQKQLLFISNSGEVLGKRQVETGRTYGSWGFLFNEAPQTQ